jgi:hypothetical protein
MTYLRPQLTGYAAITAIQGSKGGNQLEPPSTSIHTTPAYEADE